MVRGTRLAMPCSTISGDRFTVPGVRFSLPLNQRGGLGARCRTVDQAAQPPLDTTKYQMAKLGACVCV